MTIFRRLLYLERNWIDRWLPLRRVLPALSRIPGYFSNWHQYEILLGEHLPIFESYPCLLDQTNTTPVGGHYLHQAIWAAQKIANDRPSLHVDIGSQLQWAGVIAAFIPVVFIDIRPPEEPIHNLIGVASDILHLPFATGSVASLSCLSVAEHIGLGRYGDPLNPMGTCQAIKELARVLAPKGSLYFSLPVGRQRECFNAHRVYAPDKIIELFSDLDLVEFSAEDDRGRLCPGIKAETMQNAEYACGLFWFRKS